MHKTKKQIRNYPQLLLLIVIIVISALLLPQFSTLRNIQNILKQTSQLIIMACGISLVVITGNLDLSIGSIFSFTIVVSMLFQSEGNLALAILAPLVIGIALGAINGLIISKFRINSVIVTLGTLNIFGGFAIWLTDGLVVLGIKDTLYSQIAEGTLFDLPVFVYLSAIIILLAIFFLRKTRSGRDIYYIGRNYDAALTAGVRVQGTVLLTYMVSGFCAALAALILGSRMLYATPSAGLGLEFNALTAVVVGGISLNGGKGNIFNAVIGVVFLQVIINILTLAGVPYEYQDVLKGLLILIAVMIDFDLRKANEN